MLNEGILALVEGNCNFYDIVKNKPFHEDILHHVFKCTSCDCRFRYLLIPTMEAADNGGSWIKIGKLK